MGEIWIWCSFKGGKHSLWDCELVAKARELANATGSVLAVVSVMDERQMPEVAPGADMFRLAIAEGSAYIKADILSSMASQYQPDVILFNTGIEESLIAARVAALLNTGLSADCTDLFIEDKEFIMRRPAYGGGVVADIICPQKRPQMATVRPGSFTGLRCCISYPLTHCEWSVIPHNLPPDPITVLSREIIQAGKSLEGAKIVVGGGLGIGSKADFALIEELANELGGVHGATRAAVDAGYAGWRFQIGQTGTTIHPDLYLAFGISGAVHHIMGIHASKRIVAVNRDPNAPIFDYSDIAIVADWKEVAEELLAVSKKEMWPKRRDLF